MLGQHASLQVDLSLQWLPVHQNEILSKSEPLPKTSANSTKYNVQDEPQQDCENACTSLSHIK